MSRRRYRSELIEPLEARALLSTITVTSLDDDTEMNGEVTLREALAAANSDQSVDGSEAGDGADTIVFAAGLEGGTITLNGSQLRITSNVSIDAPSDRVTIDARGQSRIFEIGDVEDVSLNNLRLESGRARNGGAVHSQAEALTIHNSRFVANEATNAGGGVYVERTDNGSLTVIDTWFNSNSAVIAAGIRLEGDPDRPNDVILNTTIESSIFRANSGEGIVTANFTGEASAADPTLRNTSSVSDSQFIANDAGDGVVLFMRNVSNTEFAENSADGVLEGARSVSGSTFEANDVTDFVIELELPFSDVGVVQNTSLITNDADKVITTDTCEDAVGVTFRFENVEVISNEEAQGIHTAGCVSDTEVVNSLISGNGHGLRGAAELSIIGSNIEGNSEFGATSDTIVIRDSSFGWNKFAVSAANGLDATNSTFSQNFEGGVFTNTGSLRLDHVTVADNGSFSFGGVRNNGRSGEGTTVISNSIIARNYRINTGQPLDISTKSGDLQVTHSLIGANTDTGLGVAPPGSPDANGNIIGSALEPVDPLLGVLHDNGGDTPTRALAPTSPARDAALANPELQTDQIGRNRTIGDLPDMGAFEFDSSLREAPRLVMWTLRDFRREEEGTLPFRVGVTDVPLDGESVTFDIETIGKQGDEGAMIGEDFLDASTTLTFDPTSLPVRTIEVPLIEDGIPEVFQHFDIEAEVTSGDAEVATSLLRAWIYSEDKAILNFQKETDVEEGETASLEVSIDREVQGAFTVSGSIGIGPSSTSADADDFDAPDIALTFSGDPDETHEILIPIVDDDEVEPEETFRVRFDYSAVVTPEFNEAAITIGLDEAGAVLNGNELLIVGSHEADTVNATEELGIITVEVNGSSELFDASSVSFLRILTYSGSDRATSETDKPAIIETGPGNDRIVSGGGSDLILAGNGNDRIYGGDEEGALAGDTIFGGNGRDTIYGEGGRDSIVGEDGNDSLLGGPGDDFIRANAGRDTLKGGGGRDQMWGSTGRDLMLGGNDRDFLHPGDGADTVDGGGGADDIFTSNGDDELNGGAGADRIEDLTATIRGGNGNDTLHGLIVFGDDGDDYLFGGDADERYSVEPASLSGGNGRDTLIGNLGDDTLAGNGGDDFLFGDSGSDSLLGGAHRDTLYGDSGLDTLLGGDHPDILFGGGGGDLLDGGRHKDVLFAGTGIDTLNGGGSSDLLNASGLTIGHGAGGIEFAGQILATWRTADLYSDRIDNVTAILNSSGKASGWDEQDSAADVFETDPSPDWFHVDSSLDQFTLKDGELFVELED